MLQTAGTEEMDLQIWPSIYIYEFVKLGATILRAQCHISITCKPGFIIIIRLSQCPQRCRYAFFWDSLYMYAIQLCSKCLINKDDIRHYVLNTIMGNALLLTHDDELGRCIHGGYIHKVENTMVHCF